METSPAQRLMGRCCKTLLPTPETLLEPRFSPLNDANKLRIQKERQRKYYNRGKRALPPIKQGETVRIRVPGSTMWKPAICIREVAPWSYDVRVGETAFRRNRKDLWRTVEAPPLDMYLAPLSSQSTPEETTPPPVAPPTVSEHAETQPSLPPSSPEAQTVVPVDLPQVSASPPVRTSTRQRRPPAHLKDFVTSRFFRLVFLLNSSL